MRQTNDFFMDEELLYGIAVAVIETIHEKKSLERENAVLKEKLARHEKRISREIKENQEIIGATLKGLVRNIR